MNPCKKSDLSKYMSHLSIQPQERNSSLWRGNTHQSSVTMAMAVRKRLVRVSGVVFMGLKVARVSRSVCGSATQSEQHIFNCRLGLFTFGSHLRTAINPSPGPVWASHPETEIPLQVNLQTFLPCGLQSTLAKSLRAWGWQP